MATSSTHRAILILAILGIKAIPVPVGATDSHAIDHRRIEQLERENERLVRALAEAARQERSHIAEQRTLAIRIEAAATELSGIRIARATLDGSLAAAKLRYADADWRYRVASEAAQPIERELRVIQSELKRRLQNVKRVENDLADDDTISAPVKAARESLATARQRLANATENILVQIEADPKHAALKNKLSGMAAKLRTSDLRNAQRADLALAVLVLKKQMSEYAKLFADHSDERTAVHAAERTLAQAEANLIASIRSTLQHIEAVADANQIRARVVAFERANAATISAVNASKFFRGIAKDSVNEIERRTCDLGQRARTLEREIDSLKSNLSRW